MQTLRKRSRVDSTSLGRAVPGQTCIHISGYCRSYCLAAQSCLALCDSMDCSTPEMEIKRTKRYHHAAIKWLKKRREVKKEGRKERGERE